MQRKQDTYEDGGHYHVVYPMDSDAGDKLLRLLKDWYPMMGQLINEYREMYDDVPSPAMKESYSPPPTS